MNNETCESKVDAELLPHFKLTPRYPNLTHVDSINCVLLPLDINYEFNSFYDFMNNFIREDTHLVRDFYNPNNIGIYINGFGLTFVSNFIHPSIVVNADTGHLIGFAESSSEEESINLINTLTKGKYFLFKTDDSDLNSSKSKARYFDCDYYLTNKQMKKLIDGKF